jgi:hypothetical protein
MRTMKRALFMMVVGLGIGLTGCAAGVDDPVLPTPAPEEQRDPPKESLSAQLRSPQQQLISDIEKNDALHRVPAEQNIIPTPVPLPE